ncbi:MAG: tRNA-specific 2-thiouridylase [Patescibacteria group bacterium]|nr:tRNA-specific 2-thiouridylase [Patescibacteria group bacterium]
MKKGRGKVFVGMSGGVDSSVAAALLKQRGFDVVGVHLKCYNVDGCAEQDAEDARRAAETLGVPFYVFDMEQEYKDRVVAYMVEGYRNGITPNPDVMCNKEIKFGLFLEKALALGADYVATGHYVRLRRTESVLNDGDVLAVPDVKGKQARASGRTTGTSRAIEQLERPKRSNTRSDTTFELRIARDTNKDQSYFLWTLTQKQLKHCLFPIGDYPKPEVRKLAKKFGLPNAEKKDSQGICFLGQVSLKDFLSAYIPEKKGIVVNTAGKIVGEHQGVSFYTIGQRGGLGIGGNPKPYYIAEKDVKENALLVAEDGDPALARSEVALTDVNFISPLPSLIRANRRIPVLARVRYRQPLFKATLITFQNDGQHKKEQARRLNKRSDGSSVAYRLVFDKPQKFVAVGQSAVFYSAERTNPPAGRQVLGGGVIV